jgi:hypothetical protein
MYARTRNTRPDRVVHHHHFRGRRRFHYLVADETPPMTSGSALIADQHYNRLNPERASVVMWIGGVLGVLG